MNSVNDSDSRERRKKYQDLHADFFWGFCIKKYWIKSMNQLTSHILLLIIRVQVVISRWFSLLIAITQPYVTEKKAKQVPNASCGWPNSPPNRGCASLIVNKYTKWRKMPRPPKILRARVFHLCKLRLTANRAANSLI